MRAEVYSADPLPDRLPNPGKALGSGGSTGRPKLIVKPGPWAFPLGALRPPSARSGSAPGITQLIVSPVYHEIGFNGSHFGLFEDNTLIVMEHFDAARAVDLIERHRVEFILMAPIMLQRMAALPDIRQRDCPACAASPTAVRPVPHGSSASGSTCWAASGCTNCSAPPRTTATCTCGGTSGCSGLGRSAGRFNCQIKILDAADAELPPGQVGEIFMRNVTVAGTDLRVPRRAAGPLDRRTASPASATWGGWTPTATCFSPTGGST